MSEEDFAEDGYFYQMGKPPIRIDILMGIPGVAFEQAWSNCVEADFDGLKVLFISPDDLITAKRASGRPQDLIDAELLSKPKEKKTRLRSVPRSKPKKRHC